MDYLISIDDTLPHLERLEARCKRLGVLDAARYLRLTGRRDLAAELVRKIDEISPEPAGEAA